MFSTYPKLQVRGGRNMTAEQNIFSPTLRCTSYAPRWINVMIQAFRKGLGGKLRLSYFHQACHSLIMRKPHRLTTRKPRMLVHIQGLNPQDNGHKTINYRFCSARGPLWKIKTISEWPLFGAPLIESSIQAVKRCTYSVRSTTETTPLIQYVQE